MLPEQTQKTDPVKRKLLEKSWNQVQGSASSCWCSAGTALGASPRLRCPRGCDQTEHSSKACIWQRHMGSEMWKQTRYLLKAVIGREWLYCLTGACPVLKING